MTTKNTVEAYLNRRAMGKSRKRVYSLRKPGGEVKFSNSDVLLENVELVVQEGGRQDTLSRISAKAKVQKTVHAFLRGDLVRRGRNAKTLAKQLGLIPGSSTSVGYDPSKSGNWVAIDGYRMPETVEDCEILRQATYAYMHADGILVHLPA